MLSPLDRLYGTRLPVTADVFLTNYCNNKCPYCTYSRWGLAKDTSYMPYEDFQIYAMRLLELGVKGIILTGGGEPTIHPEFERITQFLDDMGIPYGINTNFNKFVECRPQYLKVSLDGWDEDSYQESRGVRHYEMTKYNIQRFSKWKEENSPHTSLGIQCVVSDFRQVTRFYDANKYLQVDYMVFRPLESTNGEYYNDSSHVGRIPYILEAISQLHDRDPRVTANFKWQMVRDVQEECTASWAQIAMNEKGEVMFCCHKPYEIIGHIMDDDILEKKAAAKTNMAMCDVPCRMTAPNNTVRHLSAPRTDSCFI